MAKLEALAAFLWDASQRRFTWGADDCALLAADWVRSQTGLDGAAEWRGRYRTALGCQRLLRRGGGLEAVFSRGCEAIGLLRVDEPQSGDIGLVRALTPCGPGLVGGVLTPTGWAVRPAAGLRIGAAVVERAWRF